jgi:hypothetical protein
MLFVLMQLLLLLLAAFCKNGKHSFSFRSEAPASISVLAPRPRTLDSSIIISISSDLAIAIVKIVHQKKKFNDGCILNFDIVYHHVALRGMTVYVY